MSESIAMSGIKVEVVKEENKKLIKVLANTLSGETQLGAEDERRINVFNAVVATQFDLINIDNENGIVTARLNDEASLISALNTMVDAGVEFKNRQIDGDPNVYDIEISSLR